MLHIKAKRHQIWFLVSVRLSVCLFVRSCFRWSWTHDAT